MIADTYPLEVSRRLERLMRFAFGNVFNRTFQPTFSRVAAAAGPTTLIYDTFTDTNGTLIQNHTIAPTNTPATSWTAMISIVGAEDTCTIQSNKVTYINPEDTNEAAGSVVDAGVASCTAVVQVTTANLTTSYPQGIIGRYSSASSFWNFGVDNSNNVIELTENLFGTVRASAAKTIADNTAYTITATMSGDVLTLDVDGTNCTYTSTTNNDKTKHGLLFYSRNSNASAFDDFKVTVP